MKHVLLSQKSIARRTMMLLAVITLGMAAGTNAMAAGRGGGGGGGFGGGGHMGGGSPGGFGGAHVGGLGGAGLGGGRMGGGSPGGLAGARMGNLGGGQFHGSRPGGFGDGHHRFGGAFRGGTFGYFPGYDDYGYGDYTDDGACFQYRHIHTAAGWRWRQIWVCN